MRRILFASWLCLLLLLVQSPLRAQGAEPALSLVQEAEAAQLRRVLAAPVPAGATVDALRRLYVQKTEAALRLSDVAERERVLREAIARLPDDSRWHNDLAVLLKNEGRWDESRKHFDAAIQRATRPPIRLLYQVNLARLQFERGADDAHDRVTSVRRDAEAILPTLPPSSDRVIVQRTLGLAAGLQAALHARSGELNEELAAAAESERHLRAALLATEALPAGSAPSLVFPAADLAAAQKSRAQALQRLGRFAEAETLLGEHLQLIGRYPVEASFAAGAHHAIGVLRIQQREFAEAERQLRLALQVLDGLGYSRTGSAQVAKLADLVIALWAQGRHADARHELDALDERARRTGAPRSRLRLSYERGLVALKTGRPAEAAALFADLAERNRARFGAGHYFVAQAAGLQGVALWQAGGTEQRERAAELLKQAVFDYQLPRNADYLTDSSIRKPVRELIFATYVEAAARRGGLQALLALGVADRLIDGVTSQAMADAALRSATGNPALAALVRQEQDARNELLALQQALQGTPTDEPSAAADTPRLRRRIGELELLRQQAQERIRGRFPGYDRLLRPPLVSATDVAQRLGRDEAMLLALPTDQALYLWLLSADELPSFVRVDIGLPALQALVARLRSTIEFPPRGTRLSQFDRAAAQELFRQVLAPVAPAWRSRKHLIVATSGPLALVPFATFLTAAPPAGDNPWPWLARDIAVSHVPSVSAWLALRQMAPGQAAAEPLMAWGDPSFAPLPARPEGAVRRDIAAARPSATRTLLELAPLPETRDEILAIAAALRSNRETDLLFGARATRDSVIEASRSGVLSRKRVLVFATHGLMAGDLPGLDQPALAMSFAVGNPDPAASVVGLADVLGLQLNADWVVLSACNTAASDGKAQEALSGLARGFLYAGSRSLLVTHWPVETESAKLITTGTFEHQAANPRSSKAASLQQSMLKVMAMPKYSHPAYWAPFVLIGDGAR